MHRPVVVLDPGGYRNDPADHLHNFVSRDGTPPAELRAIAREQLVPYETVQVRDVGATEVVPDGDGFVVHLADGPDGPQEPLRTRRVLLATGLRDTLPPHPGLAELFGSVVAHCPYCHGHEFSGQHVAVLGSGPHVARVAMLVGRIASRITVLADGGELDPASREVLERAGVGVRPEKVLGVCRSAVGARVELDGGPAEEVGGLFVAPTFAQAAPFAEQLGLDLLPSGCVEVGFMGQHQPSRRVRRRRHGAPGVLPRPAGLGAHRRGVRAGGRDRRRPRPDGARQRPPVAGVGLRVGRASAPPPRRAGRARGRGRRRRRRRSAR